MSENNRDYKADYEALRRLHNSANDAIVVLQKRVIELEKQLVLVLDNNENLEKKMLIQRDTLTSVITDSNKNEQDNITEIQRLRSLLDTRVQR